MNASAGRAGLSFWLQWVAAGLVGLAVGAALLLALSKAMGGPPHKAIMGAVVGGTIGTLQWLALRRHGTRSPWWVAASIIAWGAGAPAELIGGLTLSIAVLAVLAGILQGLALRDVVPRSHWWWFPANLVAWSVFLGIVRLTSQLPSPAVGIGVGFTLVAAITGMAMVWMLRVAPAS
jgi:hypothetical protein